MSSTTDITNKTQPQTQGGRGSGGGRGGGGRGGRGGDHGHQHQKKESILELSKLMDNTVRVKCIGGRELKGILKGYDDLVNLVLDDCDEYIRDKDDLSSITNETRKLGLVVIRGTQVSLVCPEDGMDEISNPFVVNEDNEEGEGAE